MRRLRPIGNPWQKPPEGPAVVVAPQRYNWQSLAMFLATRLLSLPRVLPLVAGAVLAEDTFKHAQSTAEISVSASTADGQPLPDWLKFVPGERRFVGTAPPNVGQVSVVVTARDERGEQVSTSITLNFGN